MAQDLVVSVASLCCCSVSAAFVCHNVVHRRTLYAGLLASTALSYLVMSQHAALAQMSGFDATPMIAAMSFLTTALIAAAASALVGGPSLKLSFKNLLSLGGTLLGGTAALAAKPEILAIAQSYDEITSCTALLMLGAALLSVFRRQLTMSALTIVTTALLITLNFQWYGGTPFVKVLTSVTNVVMFLIAIRAQPGSNFTSAARVAAKA